MPKKGDADFQARMQHCVEAVGSATALGKKAGISTPVIGDYVSGKSEPSRRRLIDIANAAAVSVEWLATGAGSKNINVDGLFAAVKIMPVTASAGGGASPGGEAACGTFPLAHQWLHQHNLNAADLFMVDGAGDSMEPTILGGEKLLCSKAEHHLNGDGIFVFRQEGDVLVKRLQRQPGIIKVISDNDAYLPYDIPLNDGVEFQIIGKVLFKHSLMPV